MIAFVQPYGLQSPGGSSRILRAMLLADHPPVLSINTGLDGEPADSGVTEIHIPRRPSLGRLEHTRFHSYWGIFDRVAAQAFYARLLKVLRDHKTHSIHLIHQSYDIVPINRLVSESGIPLFLSIHDHFEYMLRGHPFLKQIDRALGCAWRRAKDVFVISDEMGQEYARRFGAREYTIVTDGLTCTARAAQKRPANSLRVYFMGLFHYTYRSNLRAMMDALKMIREAHPDWDISLTFRSGSISEPVHHDDVPVHVLPFVPEAEAEKDLVSADLLYQPLPFQEFASKFVKFSLSTKMISYLGSGLPILYHGPKNAAACNLLAKHQAALICTTLDARSIARQLMASMQARDEVVNSALALARSRFMLEDQQQRFWQPILDTCCEVRD